MICPHCGYKNPNGSTEHDRCRACRQPMVAPQPQPVKVAKVAKTAKTVKATKKA